MPAEAPNRPVRFFYEKGSLFRVIHVDGAHGGIAPSGKYLAMSLFSERRPIPQEQVFEIQDDGRLSNRPSDSKSREGVFREVEVCAMMDLSVARALHDWLGARLKEHEEIMKSLSGGAGDVADQK